MEMLCPGVNGDNKVGTMGLQRITQHRDNFRVNRLLAGELDECFSLLNHNAGHAAVTFGSAPHIGFHPNIHLSPRIAE